MATNPGAAPVAKTVETETELHGDVRHDPYAWLRDREHPDVLRHLEAENAHTEASMAPLQELRERLYEEMRGRIEETDTTAPVRRGPYLYYERTEEGKQYRTHCRKRGSADAPEEVLLDENALAEGRVRAGTETSPYFRLGAFEVSPSHRLLAYSEDDTGAERYVLRVKDLETGALLSDEIPNTYYGVAWAEDDRTLFYTVLDDASRPHRLYRHALGADPAEDALVYEEPDERFFVGVSKTRSRAYLLLELGSIETSEVRFLPADRPDGEWRVVEPRRQGVEYAVEHQGDRFLIVTNDEARNFKLVEAPVASPGRASWRDLVPHREDVLLEGIHGFRDFLAFYEREGGLERIRLSDLDAGNRREVAFPEPVYTYLPGENPEYDADTLRFTYSSLVTPRTVVEYGASSGAWTVLKRDAIPSGHDPERYEQARLWVTAPDGARAPISIVYPKGLERDGSAPCLLYGYGAYGYSTDPGFASERLSLLERGCAYAIAHVRGGSELGRAWYDDGKLGQKRNSFTDLIACAEHLVAEGYTAPERLAIMGGSAGGLLVGATMNLRPDLFRAVVALVPFVDVVNTMTDPTLPLTVTEYEQWGNPADPEAYRYIRGYSPYDNVEPKGYPALLATAGLNDPRVSYWEPAKWVARLRALKTDDRIVLLKTQLGAGHAGPSGRYDRLREVALWYAFLLRELGVGDAADAPVWEPTDTATA